MAKVELRPAYAWTCDHCGRLNFCEGMLLEASEEELAEMRDEHGVEPWETGDFMTMPETVTCSHCDDTFDTEHWSEEIDDA